MRRETKILLLLLLLVLVAVAIYFTRPTLGDIHPHKAIPSHTALFFSIPPQQIDSLVELKRSSGLTGFFIPEELEHDSRAWKNLVKDHFLPAKDQPVYIVANPSRESGMELLFVTSGTFQKDPLHWIFPGNEWEVKQFIFKGEKIFTATGQSNGFSFSAYKNLFLFARHAYVVENAINQLQHPGSSICRDDSFQKMYKLHGLGEPGLQVWIHPLRLDAQFAPWINPAHLPHIRSFGQGFRWIQLTSATSGHAEHWEGTFIPSANNRLWQACKGAPPGDEKELLKALPDNLGGFAWHRIKGLDAPAFPHLWLPYVKPWIGDELAYAVGEPLNGSNTEHFMLVHTHDARIAEESLLPLASSTPYDYQLFKVWQITNPALTAIFGASAFMENPYISVLDQYVLFSNSKQGLERWLGKYLAGQCLSASGEVLKILNRLPEKKQGIFFFQSDKAWQHLAPFIHDKHLLSLTGNPLDFECLAASVSWKDGMGRLQGTLSRKAPASDKPVNILWNVPLAGRVVTTPAVFTNPASGEYDVLVQDEFFRLYLISKSGRILWQRQLTEPINSAIYHLDLFNTGEGQFAFSTRSSICVIDREGRYAGGFPLQLQIPASNGVTVVDFFQSRDYRFFIACENGKAYGFDEKGSPVEGWRPNHEAGYTEKPILHFQADGKDFLALTDLEGTLRVFKKNGSYRFKSITLETPPEILELDYQVHKKSSRMVACNEAGKVYVINLEGNHFGLQLESGAVPANDFAFIDITGDNRKDYVLAAGNQVSAYFYRGHSFQKAFSRRFDWPVDRVFGVTWDRNLKQFTGLLSKSKKKILLLNEQGKVQDQFPLAGTTEFVIRDLLGEGKPVIITGNEANLTAYMFE